MIATRRSTLRPRFCLYCGEPTSCPNERHPRCEECRAVRRRCDQGLYADDNTSPVAHDDTPTDAQPGSEAKIRVLMRRCQERLHLWHPEDLR